MNWLDLVTRTFGNGSLFILLGSVVASLAGWLAARLYVNPPRRESLGAVHIGADSIRRLRDARESDQYRPVVTEAQRELERWRIRMTTDIHSNTIAPSDRRRPMLTANSLLSYGRIASKLRRLRWRTAIENSGLVPNLQFRRRGGGLGRKFSHDLSAALEELTRLTERDLGGH